MQNQKLTAIIVDDEKDARTVLYELLKEFEEVETLAVADINSTKLYQA